jgi:hypothetical protein
MIAAELRLPDGGCRGELSGTRCTCQGVGCTVCSRDNPADRHDPTLDIQLRDVTHLGQINRIMLRQVVQRLGHLPTRHALSTRRLGLVRHAQHEMRAAVQRQSDRRRAVLVLRHDAAHPHCVGVGGETDVLSTALRMRQRCRACGERQQHTTVVGPQQPYLHHVLLRPAPDHGVRRSSPGRRKTVGR